MEQSTCFQKSASTLVGPPEPCVCLAALITADPSIWSKMTSSTLMGSAFSIRVGSGSAAFGCFDSSVVLISSDISSYTLDISLL